MTNGRQRRDAVVDAERASDEHEHRGEDRDVPAGDRNDVVRAGVLQPPLVLVRQAGPVADENRQWRSRRSVGCSRPTCRLDLGAHPARASRTPVPRAPSRRRTTSTSAALFTDPRRAMPRRASALVSSGTPGFWNVVGWRRRAGMRTARPARHRCTADAGTAPPTVTPDATAHVLRRSPPPQPG